MKGSSLLMLLWMTFLTGIVYPLAVTGIATLMMPKKAKGSLLVREGKIAGSMLIAQNFKNPKYFWPRPSTVHYDPLNEKGNALSSTSRELAHRVMERRKFLADAHAVSLDYPIPHDLLFASASGLDPHISQNAAYFQLGRVAKARGWDYDRTVRARLIIDSLVEHNPRIFPGEPGVNVLNLNLKIEEYD